MPSAGRFATPTARFTPPRLSISKNIIYQSLDVIWTYGRGEPAIARQRSCLYARADTEIIPLAANLLGAPWLRTPQGQKASAKPLREGGQELS
jgi:hypothetical protein